MTENFRDAPGRWLAALYFTGCVIAAVTGGMSLIALPFSIIGICMLAPPLQHYFTRKLPFRLRGWKALLIFSVICFLMFSLINLIKNQEARSAQEKIIQEAKARADADGRYFLTNKRAIIKKIAELVSEKKFDEGIAIANRYKKVSADSDLLNALISAKKASLLAMLEDERGDSVSKKANIYAQLTKLEPDNKKYSARAAELASLAEAKRKKLAEAQVEAERRKARETMLEKQFSPWDGSHPAVVAMVKRSMKNPASYEHVETRYTDLGHGMRIRMIFRGTNSFGGVVPNSVVALVDDNGNVQSIENNR